MNERMTQLAVKAGLYVELASRPWPRAMSAEECELAYKKFAELILIEVTDILSTYRGKVVFTDGAEYNYEHPIIAIRKHFGVEE